MFFGVKKTILGKSREKNIVQKENKRKVAQRKKTKTVAQRKKTKTVKDKSLEDENPDDGIDIFCTAIPKKEPLEGKHLLEPARILSMIPPKHWKDSDLMPIVKLLAGRPYIDGRGENYEGAKMFDTITLDFDSYLEKHDDIRGLIDPTYVVADVGGNLIPNFMLNNYPQTLPQPAAFGGTNYIWVFTGRDRLSDAAHLVGWIQCAAPGLSVFRFNTTSVAMQY